MIDLKRSWIGLATIALIFIVVLLIYKPKQVIEVEESDIKGVEVVVDEEIIIDQSREIPILMYHTFDDDPKFPAINTTQEKFREQLQALKENGFEVITLDDLLLYQQEEQDLPEKPVILTLDDGYRSVYENAFPVLKEEAMKATFYVITHHIETGERFDLPMSTWEELRELEESGLVSVESHTHKLHWRFGEEVGQEAMVTLITEDGQPLTKAQHLQKIEEDLLHSKALLKQHLNKDSQHFSYPYGAWSEDVEEIVKKVGFQTATLIDRGINTNTTSPYRLYRMNMTSNTSGEDLIEKINRLGES